MIADIDRVAAADTIQLAGPGYAGAIHFVATDVGDAESVAALFQMVRALPGFTDIKVLVNNAGIYPFFDMMADDAVAQFDRVIQVNLRGSFLCSRLAAPLLASGGSIINVSSTRAFQSEPHTEAYSASKGGVVALTHSMANSLGPRVRVNCIWSVPILYSHGFVTVKVLVLFSSFYS